MHGDHQKLIAMHKTYRSSDAPVYRPIPVLRIS